MYQLANKNNKAALNDDIIEPFWKFFSGNILGYNYDAILSNVYTEANWDVGWKCRVAHLSTDCIGFNDVERIIAVYNWLASPLILAIPEYDVKLGKSNQIIINKVAEFTKLPTYKVKLVLDKLYWGTKEGLYETQLVLNPVSGREMEKINVHVPDADTAKSVMNIIGDGLGNAFSALFGSPMETVRTLAYIGIAGLGVAAGVTVYRKVKS